MKFNYFARYIVVDIYEEPVRDPDKLATQLIYGEPVMAIKVVENWALIEAAHYPQNNCWVYRDQLLPYSGLSLVDWLSQGADMKDLPPIEIAKSYVGVPYLWGGMTNDGIDCSGLVHMCFRRSGQFIPRDSKDIEEAGEKISMSQLEPGDLITYGPNLPGSVDKPTHIAFWCGDGKILHAHGADDVMKVVLDEEPARLYKRRRYAIRSVENLPISE